MPVRLAIYTSVLGGEQGSDMRHDKVGGKCQVGFGQFAIGGGEGEWLPNVKGYPGAEPQPSPALELFGPENTHRKDRNIGGSEGNKGCARLSCSKLRGGTSRPLREHSESQTLLQGSTGLPQCFSICLPPVYGKGSKPAYHRTKPSGAKKLFLGHEDGQPGDGDS